MKITFAHPYLLLLLLVIPLLIVWYVMRYRKQKPALQFSNISLFKGIHKTFRQRAYQLLFALRMVVSGCMLAEDFKPNRLEAAKKVAADFIEGRKNDRMGLVVFSGEAFTQVPLTIDHSVLLKQLHELKSGMIKDGTALGDGLATAINRIKDSQAKSKVIILLTDGVNNQGAVDPQSAAEIAALYNIRLYTIGVGIHGLAPYPFKDQFGRTRYQNVPVELDEQLLTNMAHSTNDGQYFRATNKSSLQKIFKQIDEMEKSKIDVTQYAQTKDEYLGWLILAAVALLLEILLGLFYFRSTP